MENFANFLAMNSQQENEMSETTKSQCDLSESYRRILKELESSNAMLANERRASKDREREIKRVAVELKVTQAMAADRLTILTELRKKVSERSAIENSFSYKLSNRIRLVLGKLGLVHAD